MIRTLSRKGIVSEQLLRKDVPSNATDTRRQISFGCSSGPLEHGRGYCRAPSEAGGHTTSSHCA